jgi:hypothetical protein
MVFHRYLTIVYFLPIRAVDYVPFLMKNLWLNLMDSDILGSLEPSGSIVVRFGYYNR